MTKIKVPGAKPRGIVGTRFARAIARQSRAVLTFVPTSLGRRGREYSSTRSSLVGINSLVIPVAGIGSRLYPLTYVTPKEMLRLVDKPIFYYLIQEAYLADIKHLIFIIHSKKKALKNFLLSRGAKTIYNDFPGITFSFIETTKRFGDGQAILQVKRLIKKDEAFAVSMGDILSLPGTSLVQEIKLIYEKYSIPVISVESIERSKTGQYGVIDPKTSRGRRHLVGSIIEKPKPEDTPSTLAMTGKYVLTYQIFTYLEKLMKERNKNEIKLANALTEYAQDYPLYAYECKSKHYDTGTKLDLLKTELLFALANPEFSVHMRRFLKTIKK